MSERAGATAAGVLVLGAILGASCGAFDAEPPSSSSSSSGTNADGGPVVNGAPTLSEAGLQDLAKARCELLARCARPSLAPYGDVPTCVARTVLDMKASWLAPDVAVSDPSLTSCATALRAATCAAIDDIPSACDLRGTRPNGAACGTGAQCASGECKPKSAVYSPCGVCTPRSNEGESCGTPTAGRCANGLLCMGSSNPTCRRPAALGESCGNDVLCATPLVCVGSKCAAPLVAGDDCSSRFVCNPVDGVYCNQTTGRCRDFTSAAPEESCDADVNTGRVPICSRGYCSVVCHAYSKDGESCPSSFSCQFPARCIGRDPTCRVLAASECN